jgi:hypothetical protein
VLKEVWPSFPKPRRRFGRSSRWVPLSRRLCLNFSSRVKILEGRDALQKCDTSILQL